MTIDELKGFFDKHQDQFVKWAALDPKYKVASRPDVCAFILLDRLMPAPKGDYTADLISAAEHDEFWLDITLERLAASPVTEEDILALLQCGVLLDSSFDALKCLA